MGLTVEIGAKNSVGASADAAEQQIKSFAEKVKAAGRSMREGLNAGGADAGKKVGQFALDLSRAENSAQALAAALKGAQEIGGLSAGWTAALGVVGALVAVGQSANEEYEKLRESIQKALDEGSKTIVTGGIADQLKLIETAKQKLKELDEESKSRRTLPGVVKGTAQMLFGGGKLGEQENKTAVERKRLEDQIAAARLVVVEAAKEEAGFAKLIAEGRESEVEDAKRIIAQENKIKEIRHSAWDANTKDLLIAEELRKQTADNMVAAAKRQKESREAFDKQNAAADARQKAASDALNSSLKEREKIAFDALSVKEKEASLVKQILDSKEREKKLDTAGKHEEQARQAAAMNSLMAIGREKARQAGGTAREQSDQRKKDIEDAKRIRRGERRIRRKEGGVLDRDLAKGNITQQEFDERKQEFGIDMTEGEISKRVQSGKMSMAEATERRNSNGRGRALEKEIKSGLIKKAAMTPAEKMAKTQAEDISEIKGSLKKLENMVTVA